MTGFAGLKGETESAGWSWEVRSVNGRGLDLRLRLPDGFEALEGPLRAALGNAFARGSITVTLKLERREAAGRLRVNPVILDAALDAAAGMAEQAARRGLAIAPLSTGDLLGVRGVLDQDAPATGDTDALAGAIAGQVDPLVEGLRAARLEEGARLSGVLARQIDQVAELVAAARITSEARDARRGEVLRSRVAALLEVSEGLDEARLAQELAMIAVKADVTEELDRLEAHVSAARDLLAAPGPVGRKFDFLTQEFNREANTLCSKSGSSELTAVGLEMKVAIDQMREQVQNVE